MKQAILTSSVILAYVLITQYGRRSLSWPRWLPAVILIPVAAVVYLSRAPFVLMALVMYGLRFAVIAVRARQAHHVSAGRPRPSGARMTGGR